MESTLNYSITPLAADRAYIGKWEKALYTTATITLLADTTCEIVAYQSLNKTQEQITSFQTLANQYNTFNLVLDLPYVYFSVRNNSATDQTLLNFSVIYKNVYIPPAGSGSDVNITNTSLPCAQYGTWSLSVDNFPASTTISNTVSTSDLTTHTKLDSVITDLDKFKFNADNLKVEVQNASLAVTNSALTSMTFNSGSLLTKDSSLYDLLNTKGTLQLYDNAIIAGGATASLNLSSKKVTNMTFYGSQDSNGNVLTVQFSNNGSNWCDSQYNYTFGASSSGYFGFNIQACPYYVRVKSVNACNLTIQCDYC